MLKIGDKYFEVKIIRKKNKNIYLRIRGNTLEITCPKWVSNDEILRFINSKSDWVNKTANKNSIKNETSKLVIGNNIYYLGKKYQFIVIEGRSTLKVYSDRIVVYCKGGTIENALNVFYKESKSTLMRFIEEIEPKYLNIIKDYGYVLNPNYKIRVLSSAWGVNYPKKNLITINEKLIHFDLECLEAVLWHELLHFVIPNHSKRFHEVLDYHMPRYKEIMKTIY